MQGLQKRHSMAIAISTNHIYIKVVANWHKISEDGYYRVGDGQAAQRTQLNN